MEKVYENALVVELRRSGLQALPQQTLQVRYLGIVVGDYCADIVVNGLVLLELKASKTIDENHLCNC